MQLGGVVARLVGQEAQVPVGHLCSRPCILDSIRCALVADWLQYLLSGRHTLLWQGWKPPKSQGAGGSLPKRASLRCAGLSAQPRHCHVGSLACPSKCWLLGRCPGTAGASAPISWLPSMCMTGMEAVRGCARRP